jgi:hypothetical protein
MRMAVARVNVDPNGTLDSVEFDGGIKRLRDQGFDVIAPQFNDLPAQRREIEILIEAANQTEAAAKAVSAAEDAFPGPVAAGTVTFISRGTDADALGILDGFGVHGTISRIESNGEEVAVVTMTADQHGRVPESRLHTALEAGLNCEVRIVVQ